MAAENKTTSGGVAAHVLAALLLFAGVALASFPAAAYSSSPSRVHHGHRSSRRSNRGFWIEDDMFLKDNRPFRIIGGDVHYFRVLPQYWEDRLLRAKALGLNTVQTYVPWNLHEPEPQRWNFEGIADIVSYLKLAQKLGLLVMLRAGPYICGEWDLGGFPAWLLAIEPGLKLRSSDVAFLDLVKRWWAVLLPKIVPLLYENGGPIIMVQVENEFGSYGDDKAYLRSLVALARGHLGNNIILYTTDGGTRTTLERGTIYQEGVFSAVDFSTGEDSAKIFQLQKAYNLPGKSPPLSAEFYTGWLTHWGEQIAETDANFTAAALEKILYLNGSVVLYLAHGGTNFGFYNGANTGQNESDYKPDLTSYDYDAPIKESGDVDNPKYKALRNIIQKYVDVPLPSPPPDNEKASYGSIALSKIASLFDVLNETCDPTEIVQSEQPIAMESIGQMFGFLLYVSQFSVKETSSILSIPKVHDRAQVFVSCSIYEKKGSPLYIGIIERGSNRVLKIPRLQCSLNLTLFVLVENLGRVNYGPYLHDKKGILSAVMIDGIAINSWKLYPISFEKLSKLSKTSPHKQISDSRTAKLSAPSTFRDHSSPFTVQNSWFTFSVQESVSEEPGYYEGHFYIDRSKHIKDTFISFHGWNKGIAFVNDFNIGRFWPSLGPQCTLYVPAPILRHGKNTVVILELHTPKHDHTINLVDEPDFTCGSNLRQS